jgi:hypothetical protein
MTEGFPAAPATRRRRHATKSTDDEVAASEAVAVRAAGEAAGPGGRKLGVPRRRQGQDNWCWAACVDMVLHFYDLPGVKQCEIVGRKIKRADCCDDPKSDEFSAPCAPKFMRGVWLAWGLAARSHLPRKGRLGWITEAALKRELDEGRPVEVGMRWASGGGHAVVVRGWRAARGGAFYYVNDPWNWADGARAKLFDEGVGQVSYRELRTAYGMGRWRWTWTGLSPEG